MSYNTLASLDKGLTKVLLQMPNAHDVSGICSLNISLLTYLIMTR